MKTKKDEIKEFKEWAKNKPENEIRAALAHEGVSGTTIRLLLNGDYKNSPSPMLKRALTAITDKAS